MGSNDAYPWTRRPDEGSSPYAAFQAYLRLGPKRSLRRTAEAIGKSQPYMEQLSGMYDWANRAREYDTYLMTAETDGAADWLTNARTETQKLADKLRGLLSDRLDDCIKRRSNPAAQWSQAATVLLKMQVEAVSPVENERMQAELDRVSKLLERITGEEVT